MTEIISLKEINKSYRFKKNHYEVLKKINFTVNQGDMIAIMGESGAGKTTLLNLIGFLDTSFTGRYDFYGQNTALMDVQSFAKLRNQKLGFVLQESAVINDITVEENILLPAYYSKEGSKFYEKKMEEIANRIGIQDILSKYPKMLSGGQKARVVLARALLMSPAIILADEPTASLDEKNKNTILDYLKELNDQGTTIITVTHDYNVAETHKQVYQIVNGKIERRV
ncbi:ABC transporter ATP-binding protein [Enterococcus nangangensis]|uniref:ABC transporter ATP-binding protein n=1 Tax=Enterococcus nangangensis TaxID=2559926 RepID=UPI0010F67544|nr:ABC transporter ATP-binding protein [Enterococcus nangangensis]